MEAHAFLHAESRLTHARGAEDVFRMLLRQYGKKSPDSRRLAEALHLLFVNRYDQIFRDSLRASEDRSE